MIWHEVKKGGFYRHYPSGVEIEVLDIIEQRNDTVLVWHILNRKSYWGHKFKDKFKDIDWKNMAEIKNYEKS